MTLQKNRAGSFHFINRTIKVAGVKADSAASVKDDVRVKPEVARVKCAVFDAIVQREPEQVNIVDGTLF